MKENKKKFNLNNFSTPNVRFSLRLTESLQEKLADYSQKYNISINTLILECIKYALENKIGDEK